MSITCILFIILGTNPFEIKNDALAIQKEIFEFGPVVAGMDIYPDFALYKGGIYEVITLR